MKNYQIENYNNKYKEAFYNLNVRWIEKYFKIEPKDLEQLNNPEDCLRSGGEIFFVLDRELVVGTCAMYKIAPNVFELAKMAVSPDYQGQGLGDLLMVKAEDWARSQKASEIHILSNTVLESAINLYKKHGYVTTALGESNPDYERCNIEMLKTL